MDTDTLSTIDATMRAIRKRLASARWSAGLSQPQAAKLMGYETGMAISHFETGRHRLTVEKLLLFCALYGVSVEWVLTGVNSTFDAQSIVDAVGAVTPALHTLLDVLEPLAGVAQVSRNGAQGEEEG